MEPTCRRCGNSCRTMYLWQGPLSLFRERETRKWVEGHAVETFTRQMPDGQRFWGVKMELPCQHLVRAADGRFACRIYNERPHICEEYRGINPDGPQPQCGYGSPDSGLLE